MYRVLKHTLVNERVILIYIYILRIYIYTHVNVLVYHGVMDMLLPAAGMGKALENTPWKEQEAWNQTEKKVLEMTWRTD